MRRIVRRTATVVTVQTWTVTWVEEMPEPETPRDDPLAILPAEPPEMPAIPPTATLPDSSAAARFGTAAPRGDAALQSDGADFGAA